MNTPKTLALALVATTFLAGAAVAAAPTPKADEGFFAGKWAGSVGGTSNYVFRGISQTADAPAVQGNIDYVFDNGLKLGVWGSNVDFDASDATLEVDLYAAYTQSWDKLTGEVGVIHYAYPGSVSTDNLDYTEGYVSLGYDFGFASLTGSFNYTPEYSFDSGDATYARIYAKVPLPYGLTLDGWYGSQTFDDNTAVALPDYNDWAIGLAYGINDFTIKAQYTDTDITTAECGGTDNCAEKATLSVSKAF